MGKKVCVLGIDPGTRVTGYGIIKAEGHTKEVLDYGCIRPPATKHLNERYLILHTSVASLIETYTPTAIAIETQYVAKNVQSALKLGMARGVITLAATQAGIPVYEYAPSVAKKAAVGVGSAKKGDIQRMIQMVLGLQTLPTPEDAADALALALCYLHREKTLHV